MNNIIKFPSGAIPASALAGTAPHAPSSVPASPRSHSRAEITEVAKAMPRDLRLMAQAVGFRAGATPGCHDQWLEELCSAIWRGSHMGHDALSLGEKI